MAGAFVVRASIVALRKGYITINARTQFVTYTRENNPVEFWFYVLFFILGGILISCFGVCFLPGNFNIFRSFLKV
ncbi:MAG TPA: hypothetical protein VH280_19005, partial [Verrucomicrobiae bacterium]|nr:hypothetical protein [Verrucomicrobiae bacterium]